MFVSMSPPVTIAVEERFFLVVLADFEATSAAGVSVSEDVCVDVASCDDRC
jgi:hypothetical protein